MPRLVCPPFGVALLAALIAGCATDVEALESAPTDGGMPSFDAGFTPCGSADGFEGTYVRSQGWVSPSPNPPEQRLETCLGIGPFQSVERIVIRSSGEFSAPCPEAPDRRIEGCVTDESTARLSVRSHACPEIDLDEGGSLGFLRWAPTGAIRLEVTRRGRVYGAQNGDCASCGPFVEPEAGCTESDNAEIRLWYDYSSP